MLDIIKFYRDFKISYSDRGSKITSGWVGTDCPFCDGGNYRLGFHLKSGAVSCWSCGKHSHTAMIKALLNCSVSKAIEIKKEYETNIRPCNEEESETLPTPLVTVCSLPTGSSRLSQRAKEYLRGRNFDPEHLESVWNLKSTDAFGDYKFRIIAPIFVDEVMVSYQGRDFTGKSDMKYKACKAENEVMAHQTVVYGLDLTKGDTCIVVEGIADAWRLGSGAICCFGIDFTMAQVNVIADRFKKAFILFDAEEQAQKQANDMAVLLNARGVEVYILELDESDPGEMLQEDADELMIELGFKLKEKL